MSAACTNYEAMHARSFVGGTSTRTLRTSWVPIPVQKQAHLPPRNLVLRTQANQSSPKSRRAATQKKEVMGGVTGLNMENNPNS
eukprot:2949100-Pyramimonas_sp.AAC.1